MQALSPPKGRAKSQKTEVRSQTWLRLCNWPLGQLSTSPVAQHCYLEQWFQYASSRLKAEEDQCTIDGMHEVLLEDDYNVQELLVALTQTVSFRYRAAQEGE